MKSFSFKCLVAFTVLAGFFLTVSANAQKEGKNAKKKGPDPTAQMAKKLEGLDLTAEQKTKWEAIVAEHGPKLKAAAEKVSKALTAEQVKARREATQAAKAAGKKGKEVEAAVKEALKLTPEQQKAFDEATQEQREVQSAFNAAVANILTAEQKEKAKIGGGKKNK
jgi:Spy/CpxP family protein refolding chaperone